MRGCVLNLVQHFKSPVPLLKWGTSYVRELKDFCGYDPDRLKGVGAINLHAPEEMVVQLHQIADFGWKAVFLRPNPVKGRL